MPAVRPLHAPRVAGSRGDREPMTELASSHLQLTRSLCDTVNSMAINTTETLQQKVPSHEYSTSGVSEGKEKLGIIYHFNIDYHYHLPHD